MMFKSVFNKGGLEIFKFHKVLNEPKYQEKQGKLAYFPEIRGEDNDLSPIPGPYLGRVRLPEVLTS